VSPIIANPDAFLASLNGKRFGLVACTPIEPAIAAALNHAKASFTTIEASSVDPADPELIRFDALILGAEADSSASAWLRPEVLRNRTRPLLLAGSPEDIYGRQTLQSMADDVILTPFTQREVLFRLYRITGGKTTLRGAAGRKGRPLVLAVDDDYNVTNYLECVLKNLEVEMHFARDGQEALAAARQLLPDLILLDLELPLMSGMQVLRSLRNDPGTRGLAVVLLTASSDPSHVRSGADLGVSDYILKPFGHVSLPRKVRALLHIAHPPSTHAAAY
jgi:DNA-binding response OmpR family regulator